MNVRQARVDEHDALVDIWLRSVRATHTFLTEDDIQFYLPLVKEQALPQLELWVMEDEQAQLVGFMGMDGNKVEALFLDPDSRRRGYGRRLMEHAQQLKGMLSVDVNEQNHEARQFYEALGFVVESRSPTDSTGRPYPLLHMKQVEN